MRHALLALALAGCIAPLPEDHYLCAVAETDCPSGWSCVEGRCRSAAPFMASDGGVMGDASPAVEVADAWSAPATDAGSTVTPITIAVGSRHACATDADGVVSCWGDGTTGQLGNASASSTRPVAVASVPASRSVCAGAGFSCALARDGRVLCWGANDAWQLGHAGSAASADVVPGVIDATAIACGATHACAATATGVTCWGGNASAQTGIAASPREMPHVVIGARASSLTAGTIHTCALASDGSVACWGGSTYGQLGPSAPSTSAAPIAITDVHALAIAAGSEHTCAARIDGSVSCWGRADSGRIGVLATGSHPSPVGVTGAHATMLVAGGADMSCAASTDPTMAIGCWGSMSYGQLGIGGSVRAGVTTSPIAVSARVGAVTSLAAGTGFACAATTDSVLCWGLNDRGQLGDGSNTTRTAPVVVTL